MNNKTNIKVPIKYIDRVEKIIKVASFLRARRSVRMADTHTATQISWAKGTAFMIRIW